MESGREVKVALQEKPRQGRGVGGGHVRVGEAEAQTVTQEVLYGPAPAPRRKRLARTSMLPRCGPESLSPASRSASSCS